MNWEGRDSAARSTVRRLAWLGVLALAGSVGLAALGEAAARELPGSALDAEDSHAVWLFEQTSGAATVGDVTATFLEDRNRIAVLELSGNYDRSVGGASNLAAREAVGQEFYAHHEDQFDALVVFTTFEFDTGEAQAFRIGVQNGVEGIGLPIFDRSTDLGSAGRLRGLVDMAALSRYETNPLAAGFDFTLGILAHELMHEWCCFVDVRNPDGSFGHDLIGREGSHWSYLLDSGASLMYGADWQDEGDGTFRAAATRKLFSPLDLYLAGFLRPEEVPPFALLESAAVDPTGIPLPGDVVTATARTVTVEDVVAANGPRLPAFEEAPKELHLGFLILTRPGEGVSDAQVAAVDRIRRALMTRFTALTGGRGL
ncbi:MAG: hypothetical protein KDD47_26455, partial [Acidobacteria bacterium]|nr:hypothetical protein [Acidobacteriota bacterium]